MIYQKPQWGKKAAQRNDLHKVQLTAIGYFQGKLRQLLVS